MGRTGETFTLFVRSPGGRVDEAVLTARQALSFPLTRRAFLAQTGRLLRDPTFERPGRTSRQAWLDWVEGQLGGIGREPDRPAIPVEIMAERSVN
jgi:hypothetical protein